MFENNKALYPNWKAPQLLSTSKHKSIQVCEQSIGTRRDVYTKQQGGLKIGFSIKTLISIKFGLVVNQLHFFTKHIPKIYLYFLSTIYIGVCVMTKGSKPFPVLTCWIYPPNTGQCQAERIYIPFASRRVKRDNYPGPPPRTHQERFRISAALLAFRVSSRRHRCCCFSFLP
jgi:hypothetical protein